MNTCPTCQASGPEPCRTLSGRLATSPHRHRPTEAPPVTLTEAYRISIDAAHWLTDADRLAVEALRDLAEKIDAQRGLQLFAAGPTADGSAGYLVSTLYQSCDALGLTPRGRRHLEIQDDDSASDALHAVLDEYRRG